jgi:hypothetical protein
MSETTGLVFIRLKSPPEALTRCISIANIVGNSPGK